MQSVSWYHPVQIVIALGVTLPLFLYYGYRIYNLVLDHRAALRRFLDPAASARCVREKRLAAPAGDLAVQIALAEVFAEFERELGSRRRALRTDSQAVILVGFIGTLIGVSGAFASLASYGPESEGGTLGLLGQLVGGGLATALVSSLVAALLGVLALGYLSATERAVVTARQRLLAACRESLRAPESRGSAAPADSVGAVAPVDATGAAAPVDATGAAAPVDSAGAAAPADSAGAVAPADPTGAAAPVVPAGSAGSAAPVGSAVPTDSLDSSEEAPHVVTTR